SGARRSDAPRGASGHGHGHGRGDGNANAQSRGGRRDGQQPQRRDGGRGPARGAAPSRRNGTTG
ncbi:MAG: RNA helicase, partial [Betaproteobacteria bacterium]|nr:RNA helicase [Betaproteobacteria bacterium]